MAVSAGYMRRKKLSGADPWQTSALSEKTSRREGFELSAATFVTERERVCKETFYKQLIAPLVFNASYRNCLNSNTISAVTISASTPAPMARKTFW